MARRGAGSLGAGCGAVPGWLCSLVAQPGTVWLGPGPCLTDPAEAELLGGLASMPCRCTGTSGLLGHWLLYCGSRTPSSGTAQLQRWQPASRGVCSRGVRGQGRRGFPCSCHPFLPFPSLHGVRQLLLERKHGPVVRAQG